MRGFSSTRLVWVFILVLLVAAVACNRQSSSTPTLTSTPTAIPTTTPTRSPLAAPTLALPLDAAPVDGYVAMAPKVFRQGQTETVSLSLFAGDKPTADG